MFFFNKTRALSIERIFTQDTPEDVVPRREVPFGGGDNYIWYLDA